MTRGGVAQLVEPLLCKQDVAGSSPVASTMGETVPRYAMITPRREHPVPGFPVQFASQTRQAWWQHGELMRSLTSWMW